VEPAIRTPDLLAADGVLCSASGQSKATWMHADYLDIVLRVFDA
jgi:hypothetical protein